MGGGGWNECMSGGLSVGRAWGQHFASHGELGILVRSERGRAVPIEGGGARSSISVPINFGSTPGWLDRRRRGTARYKIHDAVCGVRDGLRAVPPVHCLPGRMGDKERVYQRIVGGD